ncbi:MAG: hypothetical protein Q8S21_01535 [Candidatus Paracaedibacteraceae bacterium]|nr:hypothetical protein [Candidatus Paracaedibacteraceae bacterium]
MKYNFKLMRLCFLLSINVFAGVVPPEISEHEGQTNTSVAPIPPAIPPMEGDDHLGGVCNDGHNIREGYTIG